ncbi:MAG: DNA polymerase III subunit epsilon [Xanthomonadaceae bacterium]|jgi:DNA polymerase-3 subunit epsilon|nr:DNA polymerase III subunit epsilon [Xanthomonadaceae bacterium]
MRQVVLDTETTGLSWEKGNRVVEIGCVELVERRPTRRNFQRYLNPDREMEPGAAEVTGLSWDFLRDKPRFAEVAEEFLAFIRGAELVIHNAAFDLGFLDAELARLGPAFGRISDHVAGVLDTQVLAKQRFPGQRHSLDALCKRLGVDNGHRSLHGALLDAELLADVYLAMSSGQGEFALGAAAGPVAATTAGPLVAVRRRPLRPEEEAAHRARLAAVAKRAGGTVLWDAAG